MPAISISFRLPSNSSQALSIPSTNSDSPSCHTSAMRGGYPNPSPFSLPPEAEPSTRCKHWQARLNAQANACLPIYQLRSLEFYGLILRCLSTACSIGLLPMCTSPLSRPAEAFLATSQSSFIAKKTIVAALPVRHPFVILPNAVCPHIIH
jgi:hypothetical protein